MGASLSKKKTGRSDHHVNIEESSDSEWEGRKLKVKKKKRKKCIVMIGCKNVIIGSNNGIQDMKKDPFVPSNEKRPIQVSSAIEYENSEHSSIVPCGFSISRQNDHTKVLGVVQATYETNIDSDINDISSFKSKHRTSGMQSVTTCQEDITRYHEEKKGRSAFIPNRDSIVHHNNGGEPKETIICTESNHSLLSNRCRSISEENLANIQRTNSRTNSHFSVSHHPNDEPSVSNHTQTQHIQADIQNNLDRNFSQCKDSLKGKSIESILSSETPCLTEEPDLRQEHSDTPSVSEMVAVVQPFTGDDLPLPEDTSECSSLEVLKELIIDKVDNNESAMEFDTQSQSDLESPIELETPIVSTGFGEDSAGTPAMGEYETERKLPLEALSSQNNVVVSLSNRNVELNRIRSRDMQNTSRPPLFSAGLSDEEESDQNEVRYMKMKDAVLLPDEEMNAETEDSAEIDTQDRLTSSQHSIVVLSRICFQLDNFRSLSQMTVYLDSFLDCNLSLPDPLITKNLHKDDLGVCFTQADETYLKSSIYRELEWNDVASIRQIPNMQLLFVEKSSVEVRLALRVLTFIMKSLIMTPVLDVVHALPELIRSDCYDTLLLRRLSNYSCFERDLLPCLEMSYVQYVMALDASEQRLKSTVNNIKCVFPRSLLDLAFSGRLKVTHAYPKALKTYRTLTEEDTCNLYLSTNDFLTALINCLCNVSQNLCDSVRNVPNEKPGTLAERESAIISRQLQYSFLVLSMSRTEYINSSCHASPFSEERSVIYSESGQTSIIPIDTIGNTQNERTETDERLSPTQHLDASKCPTNIEESDSNLQANKQCEVTNGNQEALSQLKYDHNIAKEENPSHSLDSLTEVKEQPLTEMSCKENEKKSSKPNGISLEVLKECRNDISPTKEISHLNYERNVAVDESPSLDVHEDSMPVSDESDRIEIHKTIEQIQSIDKVNKWMSSCESLLSQKQCEVTLNRPSENTDILVSDTKVFSRLSSQNSSQVTFLSFIRSGEFSNSSEPGEKKYCKEVLSCPLDSLTDIKEQSLTEMPFKETKKKSPKLTDGNGALLNPPLRMELKHVLPSENAIREALKPYNCLIPQKPLSLEIFDEWNFSLSPIKEIARRLYIRHHICKGIPVQGLHTYFDCINSRGILTEDEERRFEWLRFVTFGNYTGNGNAIRLARNGFYVDTETGTSSETRCFACGVRYSQWGLLDHIEEVHRRISPDCPMHGIIVPSDERRNVSIVDDDRPRNRPRPGNQNNTTNSTVRHSTAASATPGTSRAPNSSVAQPGPNTQASTASAVSSSALKLIPFSSASLQCPGVSTITTATTLAGASLSMDKFSFPLLSTSSAQSMAAHSFQQHQVVENQKLPSVPIEQLFGPGEVAEFLSRGPMSEQSAGHQQTDNTRNSANGQLTSELERTRITVNSGGEGSIQATSGARADHGPASLLVARSPGASAGLQMSQHAASDTNLRAQGSQSHSRDYNKQRDTIFGPAPGFGAFGPQGPAFNSLPVATNPLAGTGLPPRYSGSISRPGSQSPASMLSAQGSSLMPGLTPSSQNPVTTLTASSAMTRKAQVPVATSSQLQFNFNIPATSIPTLLRSQVPVTTTDQRTAPGTAFSHQFRFNVPATSLAPSFRAQAPASAVVTAAQASLPPQPVAVNRESMQGASLPGGPESSLPTQTVSSNYASNSNPPSVPRAEVQTPANEQPSVGATGGGVPPSSMRSQGSFNSVPTMPRIRVPNPKHPEYAPFEKRVETFSESWPAHLDQSPETMAEAGFFSIGVADFVRCFCCGGGLRNWEPLDDPIFEHTRWFPRCEYILRLKGEDYVERVKVLHEEKLAERERQAAGSSGAGVQSPLSALQERELVNMGFKREHIQFAVQKAAQGGGEGAFERVVLWLLDHPQPSAAELAAASASSSASSAQATNTPLTVGQTARVTQSTAGAGQSASVMQRNQSTSAPGNQSMGTSIQPSETPRNQSTTEVASGNQSSSTGNRSSSASRSNSASPVTGETPASTGTGQAGSGPVNAPSTSTGQSGSSAASKEPSANSENPTTSGKRKRKKKKNGKSSNSDSSRPPEDKTSKPPEQQGATGGTHSSDIDPKKIKEENEKLREMQTCKICMERNVDTTILPCGHLVSCEPCAKRLAKCPMCRIRIKGTIKTFMS